MKSKKTAVIVFAYNRPSHLKRVLIAVENAKIKNDIYLILDGPKNKIDSVNQEDIILSIKRFSKNLCKIIKRKKNLGLQESIIKGIDHVTRKYDSVIVLEDDVIPYKGFFEFVTKSLKKFRNDNNISTICGYQFPNFTKAKNEIIPLALPNFISWGWAIWSDKWREYRRNKQNIYKNANLFLPPFMKKYYKKKYLMKKRRNIWTLNFMFFNYIKNKKYIFPNISLVKNIGFDGTGVNSKFTSDFQVFDRKIKKINLNKQILNKNLTKRQNFIIKKKINYFY